MRAALCASVLLGVVTVSVAQQAGEGWDGRLPPGQFQPPPPAPAPGIQQAQPMQDARGYGMPILILPPLGYGLSLCPDRAPPYFAGGFKPRGPYAAWHGSALPPSPGQGYGYDPRDPYAVDPRNCAPVQSWNGDEGRVRQFYVPPGGRR